MIDAGVQSFKIEGRVKSAYYVGATVNAYRRALDMYKSGGFSDKDKLTTLYGELNKTGSRGFTEGFYINGKYQKEMQNLETSKPAQDAVFAAVVLGYDKGKGAVLVEQRNRFKVGDVLEIVSPKRLGEKIVVTEIYDEKGNSITDALLVQQKLRIKTDVILEENDILRLM